MAEDRELYRVHDELVPSFGQWMWRRICAKPGEQERYLQRAAQYVLATARRRGVEPVHEPVARVELRGRRIAVCAEVLAWGPAGLRATGEMAPVDVVDQDRQGEM